MEATNERKKDRKKEGATRKQKKRNKDKEIKDNS